MTTAMPGGSPADDESGGRPLDDDEIERRFSEIVGPMSQEMHWDVGDPELDAAAEQAENTGGGLVQADEPDTAERRRQRREYRKANRSAEAAAFAADQARREAEYAEDDQHYVPGEPPPLSMPKVRTVIAVLLIACGIFLLAGPNILTISPDAVMIGSALLVICGGTLLITGLRRHRGGDPGEGWDDGSRV